MKSINKKLDNILAKMRQEIIELSVERGIITEEEIPIYVGKYFDEYGSDSFINYLSMLLGEPKMDAFMTLCDPLIKDKKKIEKRFGVKIITLGDLKNEKRNMPRL